MRIHDIVDSFKVENLTKKSDIEKVFWLKSKIYFLLNKFCYFCFNKVFSNNIEIKKLSEAVLQDFLQF